MLKNWQMRHSSMKIDLACWNLERFALLFETRVLAWRSYNRGTMPWASNEATFSRFNKQPKVLFFLSLSLQGLNWKTVRQAMNKDRTRYASEWIEAKNFLNVALTKSLTIDINGLMQISTTLA